MCWGSRGFGKKMSDAQKTVKAEKDHRCEQDEK